MGQIYDKLTTLETALIDSIGGIASFLHINQNT